jgi:hypothetical protein
VTFQIYLSGAPSSLNVIEIKNKHYNVKNKAVKGKGNILANM